ncbi:hypothetical protein GRAN_3940 [Granulicella sibirica]|uniref:Uncharacterized protein n=1 Tax=Granulicella sibirica TaxID=2479048 RepID=A0A4Q0T0D3_9BACT|nr:hypothetical protein GRAN_3940 [Granulicella sibirica]
MALLMFSELKWSYQQARVALTDRTGYSLEVAAMQRGDLNAEV